MSSRIKDYEDSKSEYLYKYISFEQFTDLIENQRLYLLKVKLWDYVYEGYELIDNIQSLNNVSQKQVKYICDGILNKYYGQSWTYDKIESDAMWRIYSKNCTGVRIKIKKDILYNQVNNKIKKLQNEMKNDSEGRFPYLYEGKVEYIDKYSEKEKSNTVTIDANGKFLFLKRNAFKHEKEYRFIVQWENEKDSIYYDLPNDSIMEILLDPRAPKYFEETFIES